MKTSHSDPEDPGGGELIPALTTEIQQRDPGLVALVRNMVSLEMRLAALPMRPGEPAEEEEGILLELEELDLELRQYTGSMAVAEKVDRYTSMLAYLEWQRDALANEINRLAGRKRSAESSIKRMLNAAQYALNMLPKPRYGVPELEGISSSLALVKKPGRVVVTDQAAVPPVFRQATVKMNLQLWYDLLNALPPEFTERMRGQFTQSDAVILSDIKPIIGRGLNINPVAGTEWVQDSRVERR